MVERIELQEALQAMITKLDKPYLVFVVKRESDAKSVVDRVVDAVSKTHGISREDLLGHSRAKNLITARHCSMYYMRQFGNLTVEAIGMAHNRDHSTVIHGIKRWMERLYLGNPEALALDKKVAKILSEQD